MPDTVAPEELLWVAFGLVASYYIVRLLVAAIGRARSYTAGGENGRGAILLRGDVTILGALLALVIFLTLPGALALFAPQSTSSRGIVFRFITIGLLMSGQAIIVFIGWYWTRRDRSFYDYAEPDASMMAELRHNTAETVAARTEASEARREAAVAQVAAGAARDEAEVAKEEAMAAHQRAREILERIDDATRDRGHGDGAPS